MLERSSSRVVPLVSALMLALMMTTGRAPAADDAKYPSWKGLWTRVVHREVEVQGAFDQTKPWGLGQQAPRFLVAGEHAAHQVVGRAQPGRPGGCFVVGSGGHIREERPPAAP